MKIFLPFREDLNPYLEEFTIYSKNIWIYDNFKNFNRSFNIVNIHWPEAIFDWEEPNEFQLRELENEISNWKRTAVLIYTKHDYERNKGMTKAFYRLFEIIEKAADVFIHLGKFSKEYYEQKFPQAKHKIVFHPLYRKTYSVENKERARKQLGIEAEATVIVAPGKIRSYNERNLILKAFKDLKIDQKILIVPNMRSELRIDFPGRVWLKRYFNIKDYFVSRFKRKYSAPKYFFNYEQLTSDELSVRISAADVVLVPRKDTLNSGIVFLGLTFNKIVVGPAIGNIQEQLQDLGFPLFDPFSRASILKAIYRGVKLSEDPDFHFMNKISKYEPSFVSQQMDNVFKNLNKN